MALVLKTPADCVIKIQSTSGGPDIHFRTKLLKKAQGWDISVEMIALGYKVTRLELDPENRLEEIVTKVQTPIGRVEK